MIRLIAAVDRKNGIAKGGIQPWSIPDDEGYFSRQTKLYGGTVLMGSKTYKVMGQALPDRVNYVLTTKTEPVPGASVVNNIDTFLTTHKEDVWVIGGESVYRLFMERGLADEIYLTHIDADFSCDQFFPSFSANDYVLDSKIATKSQNGFQYYYAKYLKK